MKWAILVLAAFAILVAGLSFNSFINRNKEHVYSPEEISAIECSKRGGSPKTRVGWEDHVHIQEYRCEGVTDVRSTEAN